MILAINYKFNNYKFQEISKSHFTKYIHFVSCIQSASYISAKYMKSPTMYFKNSMNKCETYEFT